MATKRKFKLPPAAMIAISVFSVIAAGTALLCIPAASNSGEVDFLAAFFTATSATCVTGLSAVDTASHWSYFGQAIILVLMQIGGLGLITILSVFFLYLQKHTSLSQRKLVMQSAGFVSLGDLWLFADSLDQFLAEFAPINTYTRLVLTVSGTDEKWEWAPRLGNRQLI